MNHEAYDAIVVGAGIGGLSAAITLASQQKRVLVLEAHASAGGKAGVCRIDGVEIDTGPSVLTLPEVFEQLLRDAGLDPARELGLRRLSPGFRYLYPDGVRLDVYHELDETLRSVETTLGSEAARELASFMLYAERIWQAAAPNFVFGPAPNLSRLWAQGLGALKSLSRVDPLNSMQTAIHKRVRSPHLRMLLSRYATYNGSDVRKAPATLNCIAHVELALGGFGVEGGMYQLVRALLRACARLDVTLGLRSPVTALWLEDGRVCGVHTEAGALRAPCVVMNGDVAHLARDLLPAERGKSIAKAETRSMSGYTAVYKARRRERVAHSVLFPADYAAEFGDLFDAERPPREPSVYVCALEACHGRRGWAEHEALFVMANAPAEPAQAARPPEAWAALRDAVRTRLVQSGLVEPEAELCWERTPSELAERFVGSRGSLYGAASNSMWAAFRRPDNRVASIPGLYLASGSAHPGGGLPLAALSGRLAAQAALDAMREGTLDAMREAALDATREAALEAARAGALDAARAGALDAAREGA